MESAGTNLRVLYDFEYEAKDKRKISITKGQKLFLISKTNDDWWQVIKNSSERPFFVPAPYVIEANDSKGLSTEESTTCQFDEKPSEFGLQCDCKQSAHNHTYPSIPCIMHFEEKRDNNAKQDYSHSVEGEKECCVLEAGEFECPSVSKGSTGSSDWHADNDKLTASESEKLGYDKHLYTGAHAGTHTIPQGGECQAFSDEAHCSPTQNPISSGAKEMLNSDNGESSIHKFQNKELCNVNIGKGKNKLSKSRSFKTRNELQKISRLEPESVFLPLEKNIRDQENSFGTFSSTTYNRRDGNYSIREEMNPLENEKCNPQPQTVPLAFRNELYNLANSQDADVNKTVDSGNISSESLFTHEEDISDSGTSHKSGPVSSAQSRESIQEHSDLFVDDTSKEEIASSREELWTGDVYEDIPIPPGWSRAYDEESGELCFINDVNNAKWFSSTDGKGRVYFFEENSTVSSWKLPKFVVSNNEEATAENDRQLECSNLPLRNPDGEKKSRVQKSRSMFLSDQKHKEATSKTSSIPRNWLELYGLDKDVLKYGNMNRTKITENGKKMSKKWASAYVTLTEDTLCFYKDLKNSQHSVGLQPELSMQLSGARIEPGDKLSSRKHVFLVSSGTLQLLCECETADLAAQWRSAICSAIARLNKPVVVPTVKVSPDKPKTATIGRSKSLHVKNRDGGIDDPTSSEEQQMKIRDRLKKFFNRRPTREILASKGIYKDEPVFDSHLEKVCPAQPPFIPDFVRLCIAAIESKEENMKTDGLYRASGNLSHVQKIRLQVDQNNLSVLEAEEDVHVLTGALKLFFRELKEPLIPYELFNKAIDAGGMNGSKKEKTKMFREIVKQLPPQNHDTLKFLLQHLRRVTLYEEFNRMHVPNLAIVFGPTLMWREKEYHQNMAIEYMQQNLVIEFFLQQFDDIFR